MTTASGKQPSMKITFLSHYFPPEGNAPATRTHAMCRRWVGAGHEVTVITSAPNVPNGIVYDGYKNRLHQTEEVDGIKVVRVWTYIAPNKGTVKRIANYVSYMLTASWFAFFQRRSDILIATSPQFFCGWAGVLVSRLKRIPFVLEIRDIWPESIITVEAMPNNRLIRFLEWLELRMYAAADHIVTVGEGYRQRLLGKGVPDDKMSIVNNGHDDAVFFPRDKNPEIINSHSLEGKYVCAYVGTIGMACGLEVVIDAAAQLKAAGVQDIHFLLVGDGASRERLQQQTRERGLEAMISWSGLQPKERIPEYLASADVCLVHLKKTDLFTTVLPSKIFEAAGMARPIINGVQGQAMEIVEAAGAGLLMEPESSEDLVAALLKLKGDPALAAKLGESGRAYVVKHFNRDALAKDYIQLLSEVAATS